METNNNNDLFIIFDKIQTKLLRNEPISCVVIYDDPALKGNNIECYMLSNKYHMFNFIEPLNDVRTHLLTQLSDLTGKMVNENDSPV